MPEVRLVPRFLVLLVVVVLIAGCAARPAPAPGPTLRGNPCAAGGRPALNKQAPIVCVDDSQRTLRVFPDPVVVHDVSSADRTKPVKVRWMTVSGTGAVEVEIEPGCVEKKNCDRNGKCEAETVPGARKSCKYDVWIEGGKHDRLDPTVIVDPCCT
jgi:hypothetical protein